MKVGIIGGAFNPPTFGHIRMAQVAREYVDEVWLQPCFNHMYGKNMVSPQQRLEMCRLAGQAAADTNIFVSPYEIDQKLECCTYDVLKRLKDHIISRQYNIDYQFIIGQDNADEIEKWKHHKQLIEEFSFIVIPRIGPSLPEQDWYRHPPHTYTEGAMIPEVSSTQVRKLIQALRRLRADQWANSKALLGLCPEPVIEYIQQHGLYNGKT